MDFSTTDPKVWGNKWWWVLKNVVHNYPEQPQKKDRSSARMFFKSISRLLPCQECRQHYLVVLQKYNLYNAVQSRELLITWLALVESEMNHEQPPLLDERKRLLLQGKDQIIVERMGGTCKTCGSK